MALITFLRHAAIPLKHQKTFIGHSDVSIDNSLVDLEKLEFLKNRTYDFIFSSDLKRCTQTLDLAKFSYIKDERLREVKFKKEMELKHFDEVEKLDSYDPKYLEDAQTWHAYVCEETLEEFEQRLKSFLEELPKDKNILICSHAGAIRMMNSILKNTIYKDSYIKIEYLEKLDLEV